MKHYSYYAGGLLHEEVNSKDVARLLIKGQIGDHETVLDMQSGLWVPVAKQADIMRIYRSMRKVSSRASLGELWAEDSIADERGGLEDPLVPDRIILGIIPIWTTRQAFFGYSIIYDLVASFVRAFTRWEKEN